MVATSRGFLKPPLSPPSTTSPSTPASTAFCAASPWRATVAGMAKLAELLPLSAGVK